MFGGFQICHKFHVLNSGFRLKTDGLLGADFLNKFKANMDFSTNILKLSLNINNKGKIVITNQEASLDSFLGSFSCHANHNQVDNKLNETQNCVDSFNAYSKQFYDLIPDNFFESEKYVNLCAQKMKPNLLHNEHSEFDIFTLQTKLNGDDRAKLLFEKLDTSNNTENEKQIIMDLLTEFSAAFFIEGDNFNPTDVYKHMIRIKPDAQIVYIKQYRLPLRLMMGKPPNAWSMISRN